MKSKEQIKEELNALRKEYQQAAQREFKAGADELFAKYDALRSFSWIQYTPWFNDGDECHFGVHKDEPRINGYDYYDEGGDDGDGPNLNKMARKSVGYPSRPNPDYDPKAARIVGDVSKFLGAFDDEAFEDMFGDHVRVTVTRDGITTEGYEHD